MKPLNVLVLCECSGAVRNAFTDLGHYAVSVDLQSDDNRSDRDHHFKMDCVSFLRLDETERHPTWDIIIMHPPCTAMTVAGNAHYGEGQPKYQERLEAVQWTRELWELAKTKAPHVALENPVSVLQRLGGLPRAYYAHPWEHGHPEQKKTGFHLHNLPPITPTNDVYDDMMLLPKNIRQRIHYMPPSKDRAKLRSVTFPGIARAMALQWSAHVLESLQGDY